MINEHIKNLINKVEQLKATYRMSYVAILNMLPFCISTCRRWKAKICQGKNPIGKPGPKPLQPLNFKQLDEALKRLRHGPKRSFGVGEIRSLLKGTISQDESWI